MDAHEQSRPGREETNVEYLVESLASAMLPTHARLRVLTHTHTHTSHAYGVSLKHIFN